MRNVSWWMSILLLLFDTGVPVQADVKTASGRPAPTTISNARKVWVACVGTRSPDGKSDNAAEVEPGEWVPVLREHWKLDSPPVSGKLGFMDEVFVTEEHTDKASKQSYMLLAKRDPLNKNRVAEYYGWINAEYVVQSPEPLRVAGNRLSRKAMIVNTAASIRKAQQDLKNGIVESQNLVQVRTAPGEQASATGHRFQLFNLFYVYGETPDYLLIASGDYFATKGNDPTAAPQQIVLDWIPKNRAKEWDTRQAVDWAEWSTGIAPRKIWDTEQSANDSYTGNADDKHVLFMERFNDGKPIGVKPGAMRFPILGTFKEPKSGTRGHIVGFVGDFEGDDFDIELVTNRLRGAQEATEYLEILFVVNDTFGMGDSFDDIARTVDFILSDVQQTNFQSERKRKVRVGIAFYSDKKHAATEWFEPAQMTELEDVQSLVKSIEGHPVEGGGDAPDSLFEALDQAMQTCRMKPHAQKMVILLAQTGDRPEGAATMEGLVERFFPPLSKQTSRTGVMDAESEKLRSLASPCGFYAIQVNANKNQEIDAATAFRSQLTDFSALLRSRLRMQYGSEDGDSFAECIPTLDRRDEDIHEQLKKLYTTVRDQIDQESIEIRQLQLGNFSAEIGPATRRRLAEFGVDVEQLQKTTGSQVFQQGFVLEKNERGEKQVRTVVLLEQQALTGIEEILVPLLVKDPENPFARPPVHELVDKQVKEFSGDGNSTIEDLTFKKLGIPVKSVLFTLTAKELENYTDVDENLLRLQECLFRLGDLSAGKKNNWQRIKQVHQKSGDTYIDVQAVGEGTDLQRAFEFPGDVTRKIWYWVDLETELP